ncbi:uncharacterized protein B4U80_05426 [Leptotrombidium deliense]|uniref:ditrans,polycis-polyprenyl diphosphate synthase [(2E,6E)-farnesyldiphosphate specific] n=1 Tax=Leptotrombidium deliense TaxID=299467 RepID=A0A443SBT6_9ACAR|nr:uncharacterized protein B4U80_05426 [Leptotrombidium deliense]
MSETRINIVMAYKSTDEIDNVMTTIKTAVKEKDVYIEDNNEKILQTAIGSPPDMFIRTPGEISYSNFFLWQLNA